MDRLLVAGEVDTEASLLGQAVNLGGADIQSFLGGADSDESFFDHDQSGSRDWVPAST